MDRSLSYTGEQARSTDFLFAQRAGMIGLAKLAEAILGTSTFMYGLGCVPTSPASMSVQVNPGQIFSLENVDSNDYGILAADTSHQILKQGLMLDAVQLACPAPTTSGYSINYLVQVAFQESDTNNVVLPFFNSANPSQPYSGQNNNGTPLPTERQDQCIVSVKAGAAATTGSQTTPSPDAGYIGAYVVTVAYGQTTITSASISVYPNAQFLPTDGVFRGLQLGESNYCTDTGSANAYAGAVSPAPASLKPGMLISLGNIVASNTGPSTFSLNQLGNVPIVSAGGVALQGGELAAGYGAVLQVNKDATAVVLIHTSGGAMPVLPGSWSEHAVNMGQNVSANGSSATATGTIVPTSVSFTPNTNDVVLVLLSVGTNSGSASASITVTGATVLSNGGNFTSGMGVAMAMLKCIGGSPVTITGTAQNSAAATMSAYLSYLKIASS